MYWKFSIGFLIASLVQALIIFLAESSGISFLGAKITAGQLVLHILSGQAAGFILMVLTQMPSIEKINYWLTGSIYGSLVWLILTTINSTQGTINSPWSQGLATVLASLFAFMVYGIIASYTIKNYQNIEIKV